MFLFLAISTRVDFNFPIVRNSKLRLLNYWKRLAFQGRVNFNMESERNSWVESASWSLCLLSWVFTHSVSSIQKHMNFWRSQLSLFKFLCGYCCLPGTHRDCTFLFLFFSLSPLELWSWYEFDWWSLSIKINKIKATRTCSSKQANHMLSHQLLQ